MSAEWPVVSLGELVQLERRPVEVIADRQYQEIGIYCFGRGIFHKIPRSGLEVGEKNLYHLREGDLILQVTFAWEGAIALCSHAEEGLYGSTRYPTFRVDKDRCYAPFIARYLCTPSGLDQINKICPGSAGRNRVLSIKRIPEIKVPLPPLAEQRRVVARIEELAIQIGQADMLRQQALGESEALVGRAAAKIFDSFNHRVRLGSICETTSGGTPSRERSEFFDGDIPWIKSGELKDGFITRSEEHISNDALANSSAKIVAAGTLVVALYGATVGKTGVLSINAATNQAVCAVLPRKDVERDYVWWFLRRMRPLFLANSFGGAQPNISQKVLRETEIPVPALAEQRRVVAELNALQAEVDAVTLLQSETAAELDALLPAILDRAFKGEL